MEAVDSVWGGLLAAMCLVSGKLVVMPNGGGGKFVSIAVIVIVV